MENDAVNENNQENLNPANQVTINAQYIKDISFESPNAPMSLVSIKTPPKIDLGLNLQVQKLQEDTFEVSMQITAKANNEESSLFLADLTYAGVFTLSNIPEEQKEPILLIYCPNILFPYARRIISDITRDGGFQPLMIDPIDFVSLYHRRMQEEQVSQANH
jgi:preprotein translocase subunit SecB